MTSRFLNPGERKKLLLYLKEWFGLTMIPSMFIQTGKEKTRAFSGNITREELIELGMFARVEFVGLYCIREDFGTRLSFDATQLLGPHITRHVIDLTDEQFELWMRGVTLDVPVEKGVYVVRYKDDYLGCGFSNGVKLINYVPKERQMKR